MVTRSEIAEAIVPSCASWPELAQFAMLTSGVKRFATNDTFFAATLARAPWRAEAHAQTITQSNGEVRVRYNS